MNLLNAPWMPVRLRDGSREWVGPAQLARPDIVALDADRADFNGALAQFAIGLLQTAAPVDGPARWRSGFNEPPGAETLAQWFAPLAMAFEFDGAGPRFMQDASLGADEGVVCDIGGLLIEAPGENTAKDNTDLFVKRGGIEQLCPHCAATALFTLQLNAPSGGAGHRTGLRGGGPLTTLLLAPEGSSLWQHLWLNVMERDRFAGEPGMDGQREPSRLPVAGAHVGNPEGRRRDRAGAGRSGACLLGHATAHSPGPGRAAQRRLRHLRATRRRARRQLPRAQPRAQLHERLEPSAVALLRARRRMAALASAARRAGP